MSDQENILSIGPFLGDIENEILNFRPFVYWIKNNINHKCCYVSVYETRKFLYSDCITDFSINPDMLSDVESSQFCYINQMVPKKEFESYVKFFKNSILKKENIQKKNLKHYNLSYTQSSQSQSIYEKEFVPFQIEHSHEYYNIVLISDIREDISIYYDIIEYLNSKNLDFTILGNKNIHFQDKNILKDNFTNYQNIFRIIKSANIVLCPASFWTVICNQMGKNVFSWGKYVGNFRVDGIYHFNNDLCKTLSFNSCNQNSKILINQIDNYLKMLGVR